MYCRYGHTLSLQVWLTACSPIVGRLEYGLLSEHAHKHTYVCDSSQTPGTMNNDFCPNNTCYIVLLYVYACEARHYYYYGTLHNIVHTTMALMLLMGAAAHYLNQLVYKSCCFCTIPVIQCMVFTVLKCIHMQ